MEIIKQWPKHQPRVVSFLKKGGVVILATDTVYGFVADASNKKAVASIYKIKKRPKSKPLPVFVRDIKMAKALAEIDRKTEKLLKKRWPGKYTFVLTRKKKGKPLYGIEEESIALRIPKHTFLQGITKKVNRPLAQTSVNVSGYVALRRPMDIMKKFGKQRILFVDAGNLPKRKSSAIINVTGSTINIVKR
jgi:L-threonylcarbamoyladenylate synthase